MRAFRLVNDVNFKIISSIADTMSCSSHTIPLLTSDTHSVVRDFQLRCSIMHGYQYCWRTEFSKEPSGNGFPCEILVLIKLLLVWCMRIWFSQEVSEVVF